MKAKNIKLFLSGIILLTLTITTSAQESSTLHFMKGMPQATTYNPALHNDSCAVVIGLPVLSGIYLDMNSDFALNDLIHSGTGNMADSLIFDIAGFHDQLKETNSFRQNLDISIFYLGFRTKKTFINFSINEKESAQFSFNKGLVTFLKDGNGPYMGEDFDLGDLDIDAYHYREYALGVSNDYMNGKLSVGFKLKAIFGKAAIQTQKLNFKVNTASDGSSIELTTDMQVNLSAPFNLKYDENNYLNGFESDQLSARDYVLQSENMGFAFDIGGVYKVTPALILSASIVDIGKIPFKTDSYSINHAQSYSWEGLDFTNSLDDTNSEYIETDDMIDEEMKKLEAVVRPKQSEISAGTFNMALPTKVFIGGTYALSKKLNIGLLDRMYMYNGLTRNSITLSANAMLGNFLAVTGSYSAMNGSYNNLGLGVALRLGFLQCYMVSDNLMALSDPAKAQMVNLRVGLNILFGRKSQNFVY